MQLRARGYLIPTELEDGRVRRGMLTRFPPGCCFGAVPVLDEWIAVTFVEAIDRPPAGSAFEVAGQLEVGEELDQDGRALSLYRMPRARLNSSMRCGKTKTRSVVSRRWSRPAFPPALGNRCSISSRRTSPKASSAFPR